MTEAPGPDRELDDDEILKYIHDEYSPAVGTADVAEEFGVTQQSAYNYLTRLQSEGYVESRKVGRANAWWLTDKGKKRIAP